MKMNRTAAPRSHPSFATDVDERVRSRRHYNPNVSRRKRSPVDEIGPTGSPHLDYIALKMMLVRVVFTAPLIAARRPPCAALAASLKVHPAANIGNSNAGNTNRMMTVKRVLNIVSISLEKQIVLEPNANPQADDERISIIGIASRVKYELQVGTDDAPRRQVIAVINLEYCLLVSFGANRVPKLAGLN